MTLEEIDKELEYLRKDWVKARSKTHRYGIEWAATKLKEKKREIESDKTYMDAQQTFL